MGDNFGQARLNYTGDLKYRILGGFNVSMGDPDPFFGILQTGKTIQEQSYVDGAWSAEVLLDHPSMVAGDRVREKAKAAGDKDWWKRGWETWTPHLAESQSSFV